MTEETVYRKRNSTADRALAILEIFNEDHLIVTAIDIAQALGVARSTAYRYLETLVETGFLDEVPGRGFRLGPKIFTLGRLARASYTESEVILPTLKALAARTGVTSILTKLIGQTVVCLDREESPNQNVRLSYARGTQFPPHSGAAAQVLLAWLPENEARDILSTHDLKRFTPNTITDIDALLERFAKYRDQGYALSRAELDENITGIAVPVFDGEGRATLGVSIAMVGTPPEGDELAALVTAVKEAAATLTTQLRPLAE